MKEKHKFKKLKILMVLVILSAVVFGGYKGVQAFFTDHAVLKAQITTGTWNYQLAVDPGMSNKKVRASWKAPSGGKQDSNGVTLYDHQEAQTVIHLPDPTLQGYTFAGWKPAEGNAGTLDAKAKTYTIAPVSRKDLITGQWTPNPDTKYTVYHLYQKLDGTYASTSDVDADGVKTTDHLTGTTDTDVTPAVKGRTGFTSPATQTISIKPDGSAQVIYQYTRNQYNIDLNAYIDKKMNYSPTAKYMTADITVNGKKVATGVSDYVGKAYYGSKVHIDVHPAKGRSYDGWQYGSVDYTMGAAGYSPTPIINTIQYSISYTMRGGTNNASNPSSYNVGSDDITLQQPTRSGYGFTGWTGSNDLSTGLDGYTAANPYTAAGRDHILGGEFAVTPGTTYRVYVIGKQTKGTLALNGGIWYTAQTSGAGYDTYGGAFTMVADAGNGYSLYYKDVKVPDGKSKARFYVQIEQGSTNGSTAWSLYDMHVVTDAKNVTIPSGSIGNRSYTAHWKITSGEAVAKDLTYNGNPQDLVAPSGIPADAKIQYSLDNKTFSDAIPQKTDAGSYPVYYRITGPDAEAKTGSVTARIKPKAATVTSGSASKEYDGTPLVNHTITTTGFIGTQGVDASYTGSRTNVGSSDNAFSYTAKSGTNLNNYSITKKNGTLTITNRKTPWAITVESKSANATYDGKQHSVSGFVTLTFTEGSQTFTVSGLSASGSGTNAGSYPDTITGTAVVKRNGDDTDVTKQFSITQKTGTLVIGKAHPTFTLSEKTGTTKYPSNHKFTVSVNSNGDMTAKSADTSVATVALTNGNAVITPVKVGKTTITIHTAETSNYFAGDTTYEITVTPGTITVTKTDVHVTYDEKAHKAGTVTVTAPSSGYTIEYQAQGSNTWTTTMPSYTNAGTYQTKYRVTAANYDQASGTITTIIDKAPQGAPVIHNPALTYNGTQGDNGTAQSLGYVTPGKGGTTPVTYSTSVNGTFSTTVPTGTDAGTYTTYYFIKGDANHLDYTGHSFQTVINKKQSAVALTPASGTQNYPDKGSFTYTFNGDGTISASVDQNSATVAVDQTNRTVTVTPKNVNKTVTVTVTGSAGKNWLGSSANYTVKINNQYHVTYNGNGADSGSMNPDTVTYGDDYKTKQNAFTRTGYSFNGWNEAANGSGTAWGLGSNGVYESGKTWRWTYDHDITLYAQWKINQYTASFNGNGGSNGASITKNYNAQLGTLPTSTRTGYTFDGWYTDAAGGSKISSSTTMPAHNVTYYAHWKINTYLVTFDANGGNGATPHSVARQYNQQIGWPAGAVTPVNGTVPPNNAGADSNGKMKKESVNEAASSNGKAVKLSRTDAGTANGGYYYGCGALTAGNTYTFSVVAKGKGRWLIGQEQGGEYAEVLGDNYTRYTWTFTANNSQYHAIVFYDQDKNADDYIQFYDVSLIPNDGDPTTLATVSRTGYTFAGWYTAKSGGTQVSGAEKMPANDLTYYAHWTPNNYTVTYEDWFVDKNNGRQVKLGSTTKSKPMDSTVNGNELGADTKSGAYYGSYVYRSSTSAKVTTSGATVYRYFWAWTDLNIYNAAGAQNGGTVAFSVDGTNFTDVTNESNTIQPYGTTYTIKNIRPKNDYEEFDRVQNLTLNNGVYTYTPTKAGTSMNIWMRYKTYTISYNYNGGSNPGNPGTYQYITDTITLKNPTRTGYTFTGWTGSNGTTAQTTVTIPKNSTGNKSYTANWSANQYTLTINPNGGVHNGSSAAYALSPKLIYDQGNWVNISQQRPTRTGYRLDGFYTAATGGSKIYNADGTTANDGTYWKNSKYVHAGDLTVYAHWTAYTITVHYYAPNLATTDAQNNNNAIGAGVELSSGTWAYDSTALSTYGLANYNGGTWNLKKTGYHATSTWHVGADGAAKTVDANTAFAKAQNLAAALGVSIDNGSQTVNLYAEMIPYKATFRLHANGAQKNGDAALTSDPFFTKTYDYDTKFGTLWNYDGTGSFSLTRTGYTANKYWYADAAQKGKSVSQDATVGNDQVQDYVNAFGKNMDSSDVTVDIYAGWTPNKYTVVYNGNGSTSGTMSNSTATYDADFMTTKNAFTRTGYTFNGWNTKADGTGTAWGLTDAGVYESGKSWKWTYTNGITLYAQWKINHHSLNLNILLPDGSEPYQTGTAGTVQLSLDGGKTWTGDIFNENSACGSVAYGTDVRIRNIKPGAGMHLSGVTGATKQTDGTYQMTMPDSNAAINVRMAYNTYDVRFNANGGSGTMTNQTFTYETAQALKANAFTRTGYTFIGWSRSKGIAAATKIDDAKEYSGSRDAGATGYSDFKQITVNGPFASGDVYQLDVDVKGSGTLYNYFYGAGNYLKVANWTSPTNGKSGTNTDGANTVPLTDAYKHYTVRFTLSNNGDGNQVKYVLFRAMPGCTASVKNIRLNKVTGGTVDFVDQQSVKNLAASGTVDLYAVWSINQYTITRRYRLENADGTFGNYTQIDSQKYDYGATVPAWNRAADNTYQAASIAAHTVQAKDETLSVDVKRKTSTVTVQYRLQNVDGTYPSTYTQGWSGTLRVGQNHTWSIAQTVSHQAASKTVTYGNGTVSVDVPRRTGRLVIKANGGSSDRTTSYIRYGSTGDNISPMPTRTGYTLNGLYTAASGGTKIVNADGTKANDGTYSKDGAWLLNSDVTVYAQWTINHYRLNLNMLLPDGTEPYQTGAAGTFQLSLDGGNTWTGDIFNENSACGSVAYGTDVRIRNIEPATGLHLSGVTGTTAQTDGTYKLSMPASNASINIRTAYNTYTVKFNANGGAGTMADQKFTYGTAQALTANAFTRTGYTWDGWATSAGGAKVYSDKQSVNNLTSADNGMVTLYAHWKPVAYTISYNLDGGSVSGNPTSYTIETAAFTLKNPTKTGFTFTGWTGSSGSTAQTSYTQPKGQTGNKTYTAHWSRNNYNLNLHYKLDGGNEQSTGGTALFSYTIKYTAPGGKEQTVTGDGTKSISIPYGSTYSISIKTKQNKATLLNNESGYSASQVYWSGTLPAGGTTVIVPLMSIKGKVEVTETNWNADNAKNKAPGSVVKKNPAVKSTASYAGWPVVKVIVPNIQTKTGNQTTYTDKPIATYTVNNGWTLVKSESLGSKGNAYYYVAASQLAAGGTSGTVFDQITLAPDAKAVNGNFASQINVSAALIAGNKPDGSNDAWNQAYLLLNLDKAVPYRIRHMQQDLSGNYTITADTEIYMGIPGNSYNITGKSYTGFTAASTNATSITCTADGEASVDLHYSRNSYAINVKAGSGIKSVSGGGTYKYGQTVTIGAVVKDGYKWSGWSDGSKSQSRTMTVPAGGGTYTASAGVITYGISYNLNNGTVNGANPASYTVESGQITLVNPTRQGYIFQGWTGTGLSGLTKTVTIPTGSTGDRSYTANFTPTTHKIRYHRNRGDESDKTTKHGMTGTEVDNNTGEQTTYEIYDTEILPNGFTWD